jgi:hypothetical protein
MKTVTLTLSGVLLATSALIAPGLAYAQTPPAELRRKPPSRRRRPPRPSNERRILQLDESWFWPHSEPNRESAEVAAFLTAEDLQRTGDSSAASARPA